MPHGTSLRRVTAARFWFTVPAWRRQGNSTKCVLSEGWLW
jgi:hypothetical protein